MEICFVSSFKRAFIGLGSVVVTVICLTSGHAGGLALSPACTFHDRQNRSRGYAGGGGGGKTWRGRGGGGPGRLAGPSYISTLRPRISRSQKGVGHMSASPNV